MIKTLLVIFTLCGNPIYVVGHDEASVVVGDLRIAPEGVNEVIIRMMDSEGATLREQRLEDLLGLRCS